ATYLGVVAIGRAGKEFFLEPDAAARVEEYAVKMQRLPEERMLSALLGRGAVDADGLAAIAARLAAFHARAPVDKAALYGARAWRRAGLKNISRGMGGCAARTGGRFFSKATRN